MHHSDSFPWQATIFPCKWLPPHARLSLLPDNLSGHSTGSGLPTGLYLTSKLSVLTGLGILLIHLFWFWCFCRRWWNAGRRTISHKSSGPCPANGLSLSIWIRVNLMWWELHCLPNSWQREVVELNVPVFKVHWSNYAVQCLMRSPKNLTMCGWQGFPQQLMKNSDDIMIQD